MKTIAILIALASRLIDMTEQLLKMALMNTLLAPFLRGGLVIPISKADETSGRHG